MLRVISLGALIILNYAFESTILQNFAIFGVAPNISLIMIISYGLLRGEIEGGFFGIFSGLIHDIMGAQFIGLHAGLGLLFGFAAGFPFKDYFKDNYLLPLIITAATSLAYQFLFYVFAFALRGRLEFWFYLWSIILPSTIYTALLAIPVYMLIFVINARLVKRENGF